MSYRIRHYLSPSGQDEVSVWLSRLRDRQARVSIARRLNRLTGGNFGDHHYCRDGVWELRISVGAGYRVYYALAGKDVVLLLAVGDKSTQTADVARACSNWQDWQQRGTI
jgi:putative addiction module killer protein